MILFLIAYLGGVLTILSPCILPVLPFVFARASEPFARSGLPLLVGMVLTFVAIASIATVGGSWALHANQYGRIAALALLSVFGLTLIFESWAQRLTQPLVALGSRLSSASSGLPVHGSSLGTALLLGTATGLLWAPCAGPILGLILTGAALEGANANTMLLLLAYGAGAASSLAAALLIGGRVFSLMQRSLGAGEWLRRALGVAVLLGVVAIASGLDTGLLAKLSFTRTTGFEQVLVDHSALKSPSTSRAIPGSSLPAEGTMRSLEGATAWINSPALDAQALRGNVVLIDFWTYSCINCLRSLPYVNAWAQKYRDAGLVVIGVHSPEFAFEKDPANVQRAVRALGLTYPVALDDDLKIWRAFHNQFWPAHYLVDAAGQIRSHHFGEGAYGESERVIQQLLKEGGAKNVPDDLVDPKAQGVEAPAGADQNQTEETYLGYGRGRRFASGEPAVDSPHAYHLPSALAPGQWGLQGTWTIGREKTLLDQAGGAIVLRFHARDVHLVLAPGVADGRPLRFRITIDGHAPGDAHGMDSDPDGAGLVTEERLYQLLRQSGAPSDHTLAIEFLDPGVQAFAFTFG